MVMRMFTCRQTEVLQTDLIFSPVLPAEQDRHLESGHLQVKFSSSEINCNEEGRSRVIVILLVSEGDGPVGHVMVPLQLPATMFRFVKLLNLKHHSQLPLTDHFNQTSGMKSSSSRGSVTGTLSLVLAQAPMLRILIETVSAIMSFL